MVLSAGLLRVERVETLAVRRQEAIDLEGAADVLDSPRWLGTRIDGPPGYRRYISDLAFPLVTRPRTVVFRKAAFVDLGPVTTLLDGSVAAEVGWRSATLAPLFPVFAGRLLIRTDGVFLDGAYAPPFGELGRLIDRAALHQVAVRTARWFLAATASHLAAGNPAGLDQPDSPAQG